MTEKQALVWVLGVLGSLCAGAITVDKVLDIIHKYLKKAQAPDTAQNLRLDDLDRRIGALEKGYLSHGAALTRDLSRFTEIDEVDRLTLEAVRALLESQLTGNNVAAMQASKAKIDNYLMEGVTKHGSNA
jgi:hypothetical protein|nr:MAG TPA: hypothetical protein [Caudoviricetes sp.]